jgi:hypothetical protein
LPNVELISGGEFPVAHFTNKAKVNPVVSAAGFRYRTFVEPPFYYQNLISQMYLAVPDESGVPTWHQPSRADVRGIHMGDIEQLGAVAAGAFANPDSVGSGQYLSTGGDLLSWDDVIATMRSLGHNIAFAQTDDDPYWMRGMFAYFEEHTYFGPDAA